jgi:phospholipid/cholesterol/gamma-HCH transport system substrate-binding protein
MLSERTRNVIVGFTILVALVLLMWGIFVLGMLPAFGHKRPYTMTLIADNANGAGPGSKVDLNGVNIGQVTDVKLALDANKHIVAHVVLQVDGETDIPSSAQAVLGRPTAGIGNAFVSILAPDMQGTVLPHDGSATLPAVPADPSLIPKSVVEDITNLQKHMSGLATELTTVAKDLHGLLTYAPPELVSATNPAGGNAATRPTENISTVVIRLNRTMSSIQSLLGDPALQQNIRTVVQNMADASTQLKATLQNVNATLSTANTTVGTFNTAATRASATLETTQTQVVRISEKLVTLLDSLDQTTRQIAGGKGTTGKLITDPKLYDGLVDLSTSLKNTVNDLDFIIRKWKDEGVDFHLK